MNFRYFNLIRNGRHNLHIRNAQSAAQSAAAPHRGRWGWHWQISLGTDGDLDVSSPSSLSELCWSHPDVPGFNGVSDAPLGKLPVAARSLLWGCQRYHREWRGSGIRVSRDMWRQWMLKWIFALRHGEEFPSMAHWGRSHLLLEDHGKSSAESSELISCVPCPYLAEAGLKSTCIDLAVADAVVSIVTYGKALSALIWAESAHSSPIVPRQRRDAHLIQECTGVTTTLYTLPATCTDMRCRFMVIFYYSSENWSPDLVSLLPLFTSSAHSRLSPKNNIRRGVNSSFGCSALAKHLHSLQMCWDWQEAGKIKVNISFWGRRRRKVKTLFWCSWFGWQATKKWKLGISKDLFGDGKCTLLVLV